MGKSKNSPLRICDSTIQPGEYVTLALPTPELYTCAPTYIPIHVMHGKKPGPCLLVCGAIHGDEVNGVAIIHRLLDLKQLKNLQGTLIAVPVMNIYGLISGSRTLPDGQDLQNCFPGQEAGSFASRFAHVFTQEILGLITHCIDLHTGPPHLKKLPQVITNTENKAALAMALSFEAPIILHSNANDGLFWQMNEGQGTPTLIFDGGEAHRLSELVIKTGLKGIIRVMKELHMLKLESRKSSSISPLNVKTTTWVRAPSSGICQLSKNLGDYISKKEPLATISDPFGTQKKHEVRSPADGVVIAASQLPLVKEGEPILQIALSKESGELISELSEPFSEV